MGSCLNCIKTNLVDEKMAELLNDLTRIESDSYCKICIGKKKGIKIEESVDECGRTCFYCRAEESHRESRENHSPLKSPKKYRNKFI